MNISKTLYTEFYEKAACVILPLFNDGGTKTKLLEAMAYGKPIVSTREGAKGIENMNSIIIANDPKSFAKYCKYSLDEVVPVWFSMCTTNNNNLFFRF